MTTIQPFSVGFEPSNMGDAMEEDHPAAEDDLDIDLDLTSDPAPNIIDDEMIEHPELNEETETGVDEQMVDDMDQAEGDHLSEHDEYLGDVDFAEPTDDPDLVIDDTEALPQNTDDKLNSLTQGADYEEFRDQDISHNPTENPESGTQLPASGEGKVLGSHDSTPQQSGTEALTMESPQQGQQTTSHAGDSWEESYSSVQNEEDERLVQPSEIGSTATTSQELGQVSSISASARQSQTERPEVKSAQATDTRTEKTEEPNIQTAVGNGDVLEHGGFVSNSLDVSSDDVGGADDRLRCFEEQSAAPPLFEGTQELDPQAPEALQGDASLAIQDAEEEEASQESPYVHPVLIMYQGSEMFLFPPAEEDQEEDQTYLISEEAFAGETIEMLLKECRKVLQDSIGDQEELQIVIHDLDLFICESNIEATKTTLFDVLEVFQELYRIDGNDNPPPMSMALSTKIRFSRRLEYLAGCASKGIRVLHAKKDRPASNVILHGADESRNRASDNDKAANTQEVFRDTAAFKHVPGDESPETGSKVQDHSLTHTISSPTMQNSLTDQATIKHTSDISVNSVQAGIAVTGDNLAATTQSDLSSTNVDQPANHFGTPASTSHELDDAQEEHNERGGEDELRDEEVAEEAEEAEEAEDEDEKHDNEGALTDPNMFLDNQESASSKAFQGDEFTEAEDETPHLNEENNVDSRIRPDHPLPVSNTGVQYEDEDFISYDPDEEEVVEEDPDYTDAAGTDLPQEDIEELDAEESNTENPTIGAPAPSGDTFAQLSSAPTTDENETAPRQFASNNTDGVNGMNRSQNGLQDENLESRDFDHIEVKDQVSALHQHVFSADDEDEITLDDDIEEDMSTKQPGVGSSSIINRIANGSSPGSLKRARNDYSDQNQTDSKRIRSG